jgi:hypothetical protein
MQRMFVIRISSSGMIFTSHTPGGLYGNVLPVQARKERDAATFLMTADQGNGYISQVSRV